MPIIYDSKNKTFKLDTATSSYIIKIYDENYILNLYYGAKYPIHMYPTVNVFRLTPHSALQTP